MTLIRYPLIDNSGPEWDFITSGILTSPVLGTVLVDTGQLAAGLYQLFAISYADSDGNNRLDRVTLEHRNATNTGNVYEQFCGTLTSAGVYCPVVLPKVRVSQNERFRILLGLNSVGRVEALIHFRRLNGDI